MEPETINSTELRTKTRDLMERVKYNGEIFLVETFGRPMAVIISMEDFARIKDFLNSRSLPENVRGGPASGLTRLNLGKNSKSPKRNG
ncbi:MAG: type II toxin-antitoxin system Phd/YefM family antitoxin [Chloroflexi bacterium]|nr:type II toxin-antitoxin system Phd/YefM family antitoxin [Chloroflexota bacterium]